MHFVCLSSEPRKKTFAASAYQEEKKQKCNCKVQVTFLQTLIKTGINLVEVESVAFDIAHTSFELLSLQYCIHAMKADFMPDKYSCL